MSSPKRSRGVVLIVVLLIVALVTIIATQISSRLLLNERRSTNLQHTDQAWQYVLGAESLAAGHLKKALESDKDRVHLGQEWAKGKFAFPIEGGQLSAEIIDMSTCFNVNALLFKKGGKTEGSKETQSGGDATTKQTPGMKLLAKIFDSTLVDVNISGEALVAALADWMDEDGETNGPDGAEDYEYTGLKLPYRVGNGPLGAISELRTIKGYDAEVYAQMRDFLCALPDVEYNRINVNTLPVERAVLLTHVVKDLTVEQAKAILKSRPKDGFKDMTAFWDASGMPDSAQELPEYKGRISFTTEYFLVKAEAVVGRGRSRAESLLKTGENDSFVVVSRSFSEE